MARVTALEGTQMDDAELDEFLVEQGIGILSLAAEGDAYAVPISFGYDPAERRLYFDLIRFGDESRKIEWADRTQTACFSTFQVVSQFDWRSAIVTGELDGVDESEQSHMDDVMADNAWFPSLFPPDEPITGVRRCAMDADDATGRKGEAQQ